MTDLLSYSIAGSKDGVGLDTGALTDGDTDLLTEA